MIDHFKYLITGRLRNKFVLITILVAVSTMLVVGGYALWATANILIQLAVAEQRAELNSLAGDVNEFMSGVKQDLLLVSQSPGLQAYLAARRTDNQAKSAAQQVLERELLTFAGARQVFDQIGFVDAAGNEVIRVQSNADGVSRLMSERQLHNKGDHPYFQEIISMAPGEVFVSSPKLKNGSDVLERLPAEANKPIIRYGTPIDYNGKIVGVVVAEVFVEKFLNEVETDSQQAFVVDDDGYYLFHSDETKRWGQQLQSGVTLSSDLPPDVVRQILTSSSGTLTSAGNYISHLALQIPDYPGTLRFGLIESRQEILSPLLDFTVGAFLVIVSVLAVAISAATILGRTVVDPIVNLKNAAVRITSGELATEIEPTTKDEIGTLTSAFNAAIEHLRVNIEDLEARISERTRALEASAIISRQLTTILDPDQLMGEVVELIQQTFHYYHVHIYLVDRAVNQVIMQEGSGPVGQQLKARGHKLRIGQGIVGQVAVSGVPILAGDVSTISYFFRNPLLPDTKAELAVPLRAGNTVLGVLDLQSEHQGYFSRDDLTLMQGIADQVAVALENARLFKDLELSAREADEFARRLTQDTWAKFKTRAELPGYVFTGGEIRELSSEDWKSPMTQALLSKEAIQRRENTHGGQLAVVSVAIPLLLRNEAIGVIGLERSDGVPWTEDELIDLQTIANQLTLALESARLSRETERAAWRDQVVSESTAKVWSSAEIEEGMRTAVAQLGNRLQASEVVIRLGTKDEMSDS